MYERMELNMRLEVLMATSMKMAVSWVLAPCCLVKFTAVSEVLAASIIRAIVHILLKKC
jgi:hypothetical protein